jgi:hypothetical protein
MFDAEIIAAIVAVIGTLLGGATSTDVAVRVISQLLKSRKQKALEKSADVPEAIVIAGEPPGLGSEIKVRFNIAENHLHRRIAETTIQQKRNQITGRILMFSSTVLTATQIIIGTVMTTELIKNLLSPTLVGIFGIAVIVSSSINQKFSPGVGAQIAFQKADLFKALVRDTENKIVILLTETNEDQDDAKPVNDLTTKFSAEVRKIEAITKKNHKP